ncbi:MAG: Na-K-Cl cotransporter [Ardenticatenaceae bacterium]
MSDIAKPIISMFQPDPDPDPSTQVNKFGTFGGVFTPTVLTVLGAIMYLRTGWVVGNAGLLGAWLIMLLANVITFSTGLAISSIATNIRVRAGGAFSIISQSLGLEVGGSVSVPFYFAQAISVAFYIFAFAEGWLRIFPNHPEAVVVFVSFALAYIIVFISASLAVRAQFFIMGIIVASLVSVALGSFPLADSPGLTEAPQLWGSFESGNFWVIFSIFFPAVTGVLAGVNMSGDLKDPRESIPKGTMAAIVLTFLVYMWLAYWFSRAATPDELISNATIIVDKAFWSPIILAGILAATFSSALTSLLGAPRILQAIAEHNIIPGGQKLAEIDSAGEPRPAMYVTGVISFGALVFGLVGGGLNAIAPLMTMFFLSTYTMLNAVVLLEQSLDLVSFRPLFSVSRLVPLIGLIGCLFAMFLINPIFSVIAIVIILLLYLYLSRRDLHAPWSDVRSGLFVTVAEWAAKQVSQMPGSQERAWKPSVLVPVPSTDELLGSYRFLKALTYPRGSVRVLGLHTAAEKDRTQGLDDLTQGLAKEGIFAQVNLVEVEEFEQGLHTSLDVLRSVFFRPNILFMQITPDSDEDMLKNLLERATINRIGAVLYAKHPITSMGREQAINVWIRERSPEWQIGLRISNLDLSLLLAYQLAHNWRGNINLITIIADDAERANGERFLKELIKLGRMPHGTQAIVEVGTLDDYLPKAPHADLNIFGLQSNDVSLPFAERMVEATNASCIFVRDSGNESALA